MVRLATDQTLENPTGVGAPPRTWPALGQVVDVADKAVYSYHRALAYRSIAPRLQSRLGTSSH